MPTELISLLRVSFLTVFEVVKFLPEVLDLFKASNASDFIEPVFCTEFNGSFTVLPTELAGTIGLRDFNIDV